MRQAYQSHLVLAHVSQLISVLERNIPLRQVFSDKCKADCKTVALACTYSNGGNVSKGHCVGNLLLVTATRHFGSVAKTGDYRNSFILQFKKMDNNASQPDP